MKTATTEVNHAYEQARKEAEKVTEMVKALTATVDGDDESQEAAEQQIHEDPLSVEVRDGWKEPGADGEAAEFKILLCWGGPAVQIVGELDEHSQPSKPVLQYQDWGTPWHDYRDTTEEHDAALQTYCEQFYFGE